MNRRRRREIIKRARKIRKRLERTPCPVCGTYPFEVVFVDTFPGHEHRNCEGCIRHAQAIYGDDLTVVYMPQPMPGEGWADDAG